MAKLKVGIAGAGNISELHALGYARDERAEIVAICDPDEDAAIKRALNWGARTYHNNFEDLLQNPEVDAIEILTPNYLHADQAVSALRAGKHVCVERPIALTLKDADRVLAAAKESDRVLQVYEPCLYYKPLLDARSLIDAGEIGKPTSLRINAVIGKSESGFWNFGALSSEDAWRFDSEKSGGSPMLYDVGYQAFSIAMFLIGSIEKIEVWRSETPVGKNGLKLDAPTVSMWKHFQQECYGTLDLTYAPERQMRTTYFPLELSLTIAGTRGDIKVRLTSDVTSLEVPVELWRNNRRIAYGQKSTAYEDSFVRATQNFIGACLGKHEPLLCGQEAHQLLVLTLAYYESARRGRAVTLHHG